MLQDWEKLAAVLDRHRPGWAIAWADQEDLRELATGGIKIKALKERVACEFFRPILHAALEAGLVADLTDIKKILADRIGGEIDDADTLRLLDQEVG